MNGPRGAEEMAVELAQHYFSALAGATGLPWSEDNDTEVALLVSCIIDAARASARREIHKDFQLQARLRKAFP